MVITLYKHFKPLQALKQDLQQWKQILLVVQTVSTIAQRVVENVIEKHVIASFSASKITLFIVSHLTQSFIRPRV